MLKIMIAIADHFDVRNEGVEDVRRQIRAEDDHMRRQVEAFRNWNGQDRKGVAGE